MTKEEFAEQFAQQKVEELISLMKEAYLEGYNQALFNTNKSINIDGVEYVDMGLPSGTLWSKQPLFDRGDYKQVDYSEAQDLPIPTKEQWIELYKHCVFMGKEIVAPAPSCQRIGFDFWRRGLSGEGCYHTIGYKFWLKGEIDAANCAPALVYCTKLKGEYVDYVIPSELYRNDKDYIIGSDKHFTGLKLPVFLVKNKE